MDSILTILIPTDFKVASLRTMRYALENEQHSNIKIVLLHASYLSNSITDLLFYKPNQLIHKRTTPNFSEGLQILKNHFSPQLNSIEFQMIHSDNKNYINNIILSNAIDCIYLPENYELQLGKSDFNPIPILKTLNLNTKVFDFQKSSAKNQDDITTLFL